MCEGWHGVGCVRGEGSIFGKGHRFCVSAAPLRPALPEPARRLFRIYQLQASPSWPLVEEEGVSHRVSGE